MGRSHHGRVVRVGLHMCVLANWQRCVYLDSINRRGLSSLFEANPRSVVRITVQWEQELTLGELLQTLQEMSNAA